jgi:hypothetical protein
MHGNGLNFKLPHDHNILQTRNFNQCQSCHVFLHHTYRCFTHTIIHASQSSDRSYWHRDNFWDSNQCQSWFNRKRSSRSLVSRRSVYRHNNRLCVNRHLISEPDHLLCDRNHRHDDPRPHLLHQHDSVDPHTSIHRDAQHMR